VDADQDNLGIAEALAMGVYSAAAFGKWNVGFFRYEEFSIEAECGEF